MEIPVFLIYCCDLIIFFHVRERISDHMSQRHRIMDLCLIFQSPEYKIHTICRLLYNIQDLLYCFCMTVKFQHGGNIRICFCKILRLQHLFPVKKYCIEQIRKMSVVSPEVLQYGIRFELIFFRRIQHLPLIYFCYQYSIIITLFPRKEL